MNERKSLFSISLALAAAMYLFVAQNSTNITNANNTGQPCGNLASVSLYPKHIYIDSAEICTLQVMVQDTTDSLSCMECVVTFDTSLVTMVSAEEGRLFKEASFPTFFQWEHIAPDTESVVDCVLGYRSFFLPPGELARFTFQAKQIGICPIQITNIKIWDIDRNLLPLELDPFAYIHITIATGSDPFCHPGGYLKCYPNPFNPTTSLVLSLPFVNGKSIESNTSVSIYTPSGRMVRSLYNDNVYSGENIFIWDGCDQNGNTAPSGVYFAIVKTERETFRTKLVLVR